MITLSSIWPWIQSVNLKPWFDIKNVGTILSLILTLALPVVIFILNEYNSESNIVKDRLKEIFNKYTIFFSCVLIFIIYIVIGQDTSTVPISNLNHLIAIVLLIVFTIIWINCLEGSFSVIYNKESIIKKEINKYHNSLFDILNHSLKNNNMIRTENILEYFINNKDVINERYDLINLFNLYPNMHNLKLLLKNYNNNKLDEFSFLRYFQKTIEQIYTQLNESEKALIQKHIFKNYTDDYQRFIYNFSFIFIHMNLEQLEKNDLYKRMLRVEIRNNINDMIKTEQGMLTLYTFVYNSSINKQLNEIDENARFIDLFITVNEQIRMIKDEELKLKCLMNLEMISFIFLHKKEEENKSTPELYKTVFQTVLNDVYFYNIDKQQVLKSYKQFFTEQHDGYKKIYRMEGFLTKLTNNFKMEVNNKPVNDFEYNYKKIDKTLAQKAQAISAEDFLEHIIGSFYIYQIYTYNKDVKSFIFPIKTKVILRLADGFYGKYRYYNNWFLNFCIKRQLFECHVTYKKGKELKKGETYVLLSAPEEANNYQDKARVIFGDIYVKIDDKRSIGL